jgi:AMMECR1 domain-containing protein
VLSKPKRIIFDSTDGLLKKIKPFEYGVILQSRFHQATFLPQVWEDLPDKRDFLTNLSIKAGLSKDAWQDPEIEYFYYTIENFSE